MNKELMRSAGLGEHVDRFEKGLCSWCGAKVYPTAFRDSLSFREYGISGMCQKCQDASFGTEE